MTAFKAITPLVWRVVAFACVFVLISGVAGPHIISSDILFRDGFGVYGSVGKAALFGLIACVLLVRSKPQVTLASWRWQQAGWFVASAVAFAIAWVAIDGLIANERSALNLVLAHGGLLASVALAGLGCFGAANLRRLWMAYKRQLLVSAGISVAFLVFLTAVYAIWQPIASVVMYCVNAMLNASGLVTIVLPPSTLLLDKFGITIAEYCSGIESIALFSGLYIIVGLLDWQRLNRGRYFVVFPFALLLLMALNIVRVYSLIIAGYYINPEIAFSLFHTYAGLVFFIVYSAIFWAVAYKYIVHKKDPKKHNEQPAA